MTFLSLAGTRASGAHLRPGGRRVLPQQPHHQPGSRDPLAKRDHQHSDSGAGDKGQRGAAGAEWSQPTDKVCLLVITIFCIRYSKHICSLFKEFEIYLFSRAHEQDLCKRHEREMGELSIVHHRELQIILCDFNKAQEVLKDKISALQILWVSKVGYEAHVFYLFCDMFGCSAPSVQAPVAPSVKKTIIDVCF